jgi:hypothetical protein
LGTDSTGKNQIGRPGATALDNCVGFANGAFNETFYINMCASGKTIPQKEYFKFNCNAKNIFATRVQRGAEVHPAVQDGLVTIEDLQKCFISANGMPKEGSIVCWGGDDTNHTAYVSEVIDYNTIVILQSGFGLPAWTTPVYDDKGQLVEYLCEKRTIHRDFGDRKNIWWFNNNGFNLKESSYCQGFLSNPAVSIPVFHPPVIESIESPNGTTVIIKGQRGMPEDPTTHTRIYYKWGHNVTEENYTNYIETYDLNFTITLNKPRREKSISVLALSLWATERWSLSGVINQDLMRSFPCIKLLTPENKVVNTIPSIYTGEKWVEVIPTFREDNHWYHIYNDSKEKV